MNITKIVTIILGAVLVIFGLSILLAFPVKWLWNGTMPELFAFKEIGVWMAWKLSFLCAILFKGFSASASK